LRFGPVRHTIVEALSQNQPTLRTTRGIQLPLIPPTRVHPASVQAKGVVYTKRWVVELMLDLAGYRAENNLVDALAVEPAAGDGAFLAAMVERLVQSSTRLQRPLAECENSLLAFELDETSADLARELVENILLDYGTDPLIARRLASTWVRVGDYLFDSHGVAADFVIGNPPYIRLEEIPEETANYYRSGYASMRGRADLYVAFFEAALRQLKPGGLCTFICADRWMRNQYGAELRSLVTATYSVEVIMEMHSADAFHDQVDSYPAITLMRRAAQSRIVVASVGPQAAEALPGAISAAIAATARCQTADLPPGLKTALVETWFSGAEPWPCHSPQQLSLLRKLEDRFSALEANARVGIGVATGSDEIFVTRDSQLVEPSRLRKLAMAKDLAGGSLLWSGHYLVDPWDAHGLVKLQDFPRMSSYFESHAPALKKRHTAGKNPRGWYKTIDRVTPALSCTPKLYVADIQDSLAPVLDAGETYPHHNLYFIQSSVWDLEVLGGLLMSAVAQFFVESYGVKMRGGYWRFQAQYLRRIRVPDPWALTPAQASALVTSFRRRDRLQATRIALEVYGIDHRELESARGY
jgi:adenine-specific DNA-methyltransferase